ADIGEIGRRCRAVTVRYERRFLLELEPPPPVGRGLGGGAGRERGDTGKRGLPGRGGRAPQGPRAGPPRPPRHREHAADSAEPSVERELSDRGRALERAARYLLRRCEQGERDRQVEA